MALKLDQVADFIGRISAPNSAYPYGSAKDESSASAGDGTPHIKARADDVFGMQQSILTAGGVTPNGNPDSVTNPQYLAALSALGWSQYANYHLGSRVLRGGAWYQATSANGPAFGGAVDPLDESATWANVDAAPLDGKRLDDGLYRADDSGELFQLPTGVNEFDIVFEEGLYHLFYDDKTQVKHRQAATIGGLLSAADDLTIAGRYPSVLFENGVWNLFLWDEGNVRTDRYTATAKSAFPGATVF